MTGPQDAASASDDITRLNLEMETLIAKKTGVENRVRQLRDSEDFAAGVFYAQEIFALQQDKLRLEVEIELRRKQINRLRLGQSAASPPPAGA